MDHFKENVATIKVPFVLEDMEGDLKTLEWICENDLAQKSPQCISAKFVDKNDNPILFYFGFRKVEKKGKSHKNVRLFFIFLSSIPFAKKP
jgi:hypothetical protein